MLYSLRALGLLLVAASCARAKVGNAEFSIDRGDSWLMSPWGVNAKIVYPTDAPARAVAVVGHCTMCWGDWYPHLETLVESHGLLIVFVDSSPVDSVLHFFDTASTWFKGYGNDLSKVLAEVRFAAAHESSSAIYGRLAEGAPALAMGHSLGGAAGLHAVLEDDEFAAAFVLSPCMIAHEDLSAITKPVFLLSATFDGICPTARVGRPYYAAMRRSPAVFYAELVGGTHCGFMDVSGTDWDAGKSLGVDALANGACGVAERVTGAVFGEPLTQDYWLSHSDQLAYTAVYAGLFVEAALFSDASTNDYVQLQRRLRSDEQAGILTHVQSALGGQDETLGPGPDSAGWVPSESYPNLAYECLCV